MKRILVTPFAVLMAWLILGCIPASAQYTYPFRPPQYGPGYQTQLSPYLNMLRPGDPAVNFYTGVLPEVQRRQDRNAVFGSLQGLTMQFPAPPGINEEDYDAPMYSTGHPTAFNYTGMYFNSSMMGQGSMSPYSRRMGMGQQRRGMGMGGMGMGGMGMGGMGMGGMGMGGMGGGGSWPNMNQQGGGMGR